MHWQVILLFSKRWRHARVSLYGEWLDEYKQKINALHESERALFDEVKKQANRPYMHELDLVNRLTLDWWIPSSPHGGASHISGRRGPSA